MPSGEGLGDETLAVKREHFCSRPSPAANAVPAARGLQKCRFAAGFFYFCFDASRTGPRTCLKLYSALSNICPAHFSTRRRKRRPGRTPDSRSEELLPHTCESKCAPRNALSVVRQEKPQSEDRGQKPKQADGQIADLGIEPRSFGHARLCPGNMKELKTHDEKTEQMRADPPACPTIYDRVPITVTARAPLFRSAARRIRPLSAR